MVAIGMTVDLTMGAALAAKSFVLFKDKSRRATAFSERFFACGKTAIASLPALKPLPQPDLPSSQHTQPQPHP
jgi:hypothetical protein